MVGGLEERVVRNEEPALVWALVTETAAFLITTNIEQPRLAAEEDLAGFELHAVPWYSSGGLREVAESLADGQKLTEAPALLRMPLVAAETERLVALGADCAQALEGAMRAWRPADRECDLAARIAAALEERLIFPSVLLAGGAERRRAWRAAYRDAGFDGKWREHVQGGPIGYLSREFDVVPGTPGAVEIIAAGIAFAWNPTIRGAKSEDTFVVGRAGAVPVTNTADWPVTVAGPILPI